MSGDAYLAGARRRAEARMRSRCRIERLELVTLDTGTLDLSDADPDDDLIYLGACRVRSTSGAVFSQSVEGMTISAEQSFLCLPVDAAAAAEIKIRDEVEILDGGPSALLTGRKFRITGIPAQTDEVEARFPVEHAETR